MPKLGWKDQLLYWTAILTTGIGAFILLLFPASYRDRMSASNPQALNWCDGEGSLHSLWLGFWLIGVCIYIIAAFYQRRIPVFGRNNIRYGPPAYPRIYPLLMKEKPKHWQGEKQKAKTKAKNRIIICVLLVSFLCCAAIYPFSLSGRYDLQRDGTVAVYDSCNRQEKLYTVSDIESVCLDTNRTSSGRYGSGSWYARVKIHFLDGESCSFSVSGFADNWTDAIYAAQTLNEIYGPLLYIEGTEDIWKVILDTDMTADEVRLLYQLYEVER